MSSSPFQQTMRPSLRQSLIMIVLLCAGVLLSACGNSGPARTELITLDALPLGIGRGFPLVALNRIDNTTSGLQRGDQAPNFALVLDDGQYLELADLTGRPVLINFWATWCGPCRLEMPEIVAAANQNEELVVLAVNVQEELPQLTAFTEDFQMSMPVVRDAEGDLRDLYGVRGMPTSVFIDREGKIATVWTGILTRDALQELLAAIE